MPRSSTSSEKPTAEKLIDITLDLIDQHGGARGVNLREVARRAGCAHTNVYNYFPSLEALLGAALKSLLQRLITFTQSQMAADKVRDRAGFARFLNAQIDFAVQHPGWYAFIWLDPLEGFQVDEEAMQTFRFMSSRFAGIITTLAGPSLTPAQAERASNLLHSYLHGEICKLLNDRYLDHTPEQYRQQILTGCSSLLDGLLAVPPGKKKLKEKGR